MTGTVGKTFGFVPAEQQRAIGDWLAENPQFTQTDSRTLLRLNGFVLVGIDIKFHPPFRYLLKLYVHVFRPSEPGAITLDAMQQFYFSHSKHKGPGAFVSGLKQSTDIKEAMDGHAAGNINVSPLNEALSIPDVIAFLKARLPHQLYANAANLEARAVANFKHAGYAHALSELETAGRDFARWPDSSKQQAGGSFDHWREHVGDLLDDKKITAARDAWLAAQPFKLKDYGIAR